MTFRLRSSSKTLKAVFKALEEVDSEPLFVFRKDKVLAWGMDPSHVIFVSLEINPNFFSSYTFDGKKPLKLCISASEVAAWFLGKTYEAEIGYEDGSLELVIYTASSKIKKSVAILEEKTPPPPVDLNFFASVTIPSADLHEGFNLISKDSVDTVIDLSDNKFRMISKEKRAMYEPYLDEGAVKVTDDGVLRRMYKTEFLKMAINSAKTLAENVTFELSKEGVLRIVFEVENLKVTYYIAPILEEEG